LHFHTQKNKTKKKHSRCCNNYTDFIFVLNSTSIYYLTPFSFGSRNKTAEYQEMINRINVSLPTSLLMRSLFLHSWTQPTTC